MTPQWMPEWLRDDLMAEAEGRETLAQATERLCLDCVKYHTHSCPLLVDPRTCGQREEEE